MGHPWALHGLCMGACVLIRNSTVSELHLGRNGKCGFFIVVSGFVWFILFGQAATFPVCLAVAIVRFSAFAAKRQPKPRKQGFCAEKFPYANILQENAFVNSKC